MALKKLVLPALLLICYWFSHTQAAMSEADFTSMIQGMPMLQKIGQMLLLFLEPNIDQAGRLGVLARQHGVGGAFGIWGSWSCAEWQLAAKEFQKAVKEAGGSPLLLGLDAIHGAAFIADATIFPHAIGVAATWNTTLVEQMASITAKDIRTCGMNWVFGPTADIGLQPLWGRHYETYGDEPTLVSAMVRATIAGIQRTDLSTEKFGYNPKNESVWMAAAAVKHWIGYSVPENGIDRNNALVPEWMMNRFMLPPFRTALHSGVMAVMLNSGAVNSIPGHANSELVSKWLKTDFNFSGVVMSDWDDIKALVFRHQFSSSFQEAASTAVLAGLDMSMPSEDFVHLLEPSVRSNLVSENRIEDSVRRILRLKNAVGLLDPDIPHVFPAQLETVGGDADWQVAQQVAEESITLLKNDNNILPINLNQPPKRIVVTGFTSNSITCLCGAWTVSWQGAPNDMAFRQRARFKTIAEAIRAVASGWTVETFDGVLQDANAADYGAALAAARDADYAIVALGERPHAEGNYNIDNLALPIAQINFAMEVAKVAKHTVLVLVQGRPRTFQPLLPHVEAILYAYLPGPAGGPAIANIIFGLVNPSGRLPFSYPINSGPLSLQFMNPHQNQWEFGYGLSFTNFEYRNVRTGEDLALDVSVDVSNTGPMVGKETVQLYLRENFDYEGKSEKHWMLKRFKKVEIAPGTVVRVKFSLKGVDFRHVLPPPGQTNEIELRVGPLHRSDLDRKVKISVTQPHTFPITQPDNRPDEAVVEYDPPDIEPEEFPPSRDLPPDSAPDMNPEEEPQLSPEDPVPVDEPQPISPLPPVDQPQDEPFTSPSNFTPITDPIFSPTDAAIAKLASSLYVIILSAVAFWLNLNL